MSRIKIHIILLICVMVVSNIAWGQHVDDFSYIEKYNQRMDSIKNYTAEFTVKSTIPLLDLPPVHGKVFFKWPAHYSISTYDFTVLPIRKLTPVARFFIRENYKTSNKGTENIDSHPCLVIELDLRDTVSEIVSYTVWVDVESYMVRRVFVTKKDGGEFTYQYTYKNDRDLLPSRLIYSFEFMEKHPVFVKLNPIALSDNTEASKLIKGKIALDFKYSDIRQEGD